MATKGDGRKAKKDDGISQDTEDAKIVQERYVTAAATRDAYLELNTWWTDTQNLPNIDLRRWLFLASRGSYVFSTTTPAKTDLDNTMNASTLRSLYKKVSDAAKTVLAATTDNYPEAIANIDTDMPATMVIRGGDHVTELGPYGAVYNQDARLTRFDAELLGISLSWTIPYEMPSPNVAGPSGSPLSSVYYEMLAEYFGVATHLLASPADAYYPRYATQWILGGEDVGSIGPLGAALNTTLRNDPSNTAYELNLISLDNNYRGFLGYIISKLSQSSKRIYVVRNADATDVPLATAPLLSLIVGNIVFEVYGDLNALIPSDQQLTSIGLALGATPTRSNFTMPFINDYERAYLIGVRAEQIARASKPRVTPAPNIVDPFIIAAQEFHDKVVPALIRRVMPNGDVETLDPNGRTIESHASPLNLMI